MSLICHLRGWWWSFRWAAPISGHNFLEVPSSPYTQCLRCVTCGHVSKRMVPLNYPFFRAWRWGLCLHLFGFRFYISNDKPVLFSERYGYTKVYRFGRWAVEARCVRP